MSKVSILQERINHHKDCLLFFVEEWRKLDNHKRNPENFTIGTQERIQASLRLNVIEFHLNELFGLYHQDKPDDFQSLDFQWLMDYLTQQPSLPPSIFTHIVKYTPFKQWHFERYIPTRMLGELSSEIRPAFTLDPYQKANPDHLKPSDQNALSLFHFFFKWLTGGSNGIDLHKKYRLLKKQNFTSREKTYRLPWIKAEIDLCEAQIIQALHKMDKHNFERIIQENLNSSILKKLLYKMVNVSNVDKIPEEIDVTSSNPKDALPPSYSEYDPYPSFPPSYAESIGLNHSTIHSDQPITTTEILSVLAKNQLFNPLLSSITQYFKHPPKNAIKKYHHDLRLQHFFDLLSTLEKGNDIQSCIITAEEKFTSSRSFGLFKVKRSQNYYNAISHLSVLDQLNPEERKAIAIKTLKEMQIFKLPLPLTEGQKLFSEVILYFKNKSEKKKSPYYHQRLEHFNQLLINLENNQDLSEDIDTAQEKFACQKSSGIFKKTQHYYNAISKLLPLAKMNINLLNQSEKESIVKYCREELKDILPEKFKTHDLKRNIMIGKKHPYTP